MNTFIADFKKEIDTITTQESDLISRTEQILLCCQNALIRLEHMVMTHSFKSLEEEIRIFKEYKPLIVSEWLFTNQYFLVHSQMPVGSRKTRLKYLNRHLCNYQKYITDNLEFYNHCQGKNTDLDTLYFTRQYYKPCLRAEPHVFISNPAFSTSHDITLATVMAYKRLSEALQEDIRNLKDENHSGKTDALKPPCALKWTGNKTELVEIIYALHISGMMNHGNGELIQSVRQFEAFFSIDLDHFHQLVSNIRNRTKSRAITLDKLANTLEQHFGLSEA